MSSQTIAAARRRARRHARRPARRPAPEPCEHTWAGTPCDWDICRLPLDGS